MPPETSETVLISIVIPTYRRPDILHELLGVVKSQIAQAGAAVEAVVVDNCPEGSAIETVQPFLEPKTIAYLPQPVSGVVHARNAGVAAAVGEYVLFLDDDEIPAAGWLDAFITAAQQGADMAFGRIIPRYEAPPEDSLEGTIYKLFSREYDQSAGADISAHYAELGTGNTLFHRTRCLNGAQSFDPRFNKTGGEDIWLIKSLMDQNQSLTWVPEGLVEEFVPSNRMTADYLKSRRYVQGQLRCLFHARSAGAAKWVQVVKWMGVGAAQVTLHGAAALAGGITSKQKAQRHNIQMHGGLGKVMWWYKTSLSSYAN